MAGERRTEVRYEEWRVCGPPTNAPRSLEAYRHSTPGWEDDHMGQEGRAASVVQSVRNGQVVIPEEFRRALGIDGDGLLQLTLFEGELRIRPVRDAQAESSAEWLQDAYAAFAPIRDELARKYSPKEIDAAIDEAVKAVRRSNAPSSI